MPAPWDAVALPPFPENTALPNIERWLARCGVELDELQRLAIASAIYTELDESFRAGYDVAVGKRPDLAAALGYRPHGDPRAARVPMHEPDDA